MKQTLKNNAVLLLTLLTLTLAGCKKEKQREEEKEQETEIQKPSLLNKILYSGRTNNLPTEFQLFTINSDGTGEKQLTFFPNGGFLYTGEASFSPDGTKIVFISNKNDRYNQEIYLMNSDGTDVKRLTNNPRIETFPSFSPDGKSILFTSSIDPSALTFQLFIMNTDGTGERQLTSFKNQTSFSYTGAGRWSPDGSKIVFMSNKDNTDHLEVYLMNSDGTGITRLTTTARTQHLPSFSPDGSKILFQADSRVNPSHSQIFTINPDGTGEKQITFFTSNSQINLSSASWSPDGKKIVFPTNKDGGDMILYTINADGTDLTKLNTSSPEVQSPVWR